ncbi:hypothetical protein LG634_14885 [Streptomyces bambusae]|uniref:hypothetical protein n=1 Tax=Streptomyces bambusae TaxID=1550616 RepID=UPI001CFDD858|nr:hypothetical protein [Streptomyces bambusae]MCB5166115.1 hypothetical protein [Streptomyces bambusae]
MLYLVHVRLAPHPDGMSLPWDTAVAVTDAAPHRTRVLHATAHPAALPDPVVGIYLESTAPELAESAARVAWWAAVDSRPALREWQLRSASVALGPQPAE